MIVNNEIRKFWFFFVRILKIGDFYGILYNIVLILF